MQSLKDTLREIFLNEELKTQYGAVFASIVVCEHVPDLLSNESRISFCMFEELFLSKSTHKKVVQVSG
jgi:hypothetical protein